MMERTKEAEKQLQRTNEEVQSLRRELASASEEARTDSLTGLPNRRALEDRLAALEEEELRTAPPSATSTDSSRSTTRTVMPSATAC
jgi:diguanylate cyclase